VLVDSKLTFGIPDKSCDIDWKVNLLIGIASEDLRTKAVPVTHNLSELTFKRSLLV
jgi:hypothetical protein